MTYPRFDDGPAAVVSALPEEIKPLLALGRVSGRFRAGSGRFVHLRLGTRDVVAGWTGDGAERAAHSLTALLARAEVESLLLVGVAGGLSPGLAAGELIVGEAVRDLDGPVTPPDAAALARGRRLDGVSAGTLVSAGRIAVTPQAKAELWRRVGSPEPAAVDLETAAWARAAAAAGVPYLALRAISDGADEALPLDFNRWRDDRGSVRRLGIALHALGHPRVIGSLRSLERRVGRCARRLASFTSAFCA